MGRVAPSVIAREQLQSQLWAGLLAGQRKAIRQGEPFDDFDCRYGPRYYRSRG